MPCWEVLGVLRYEQDSEQFKKAHLKLTSSLEQVKYKLKLIEVLTCSDFCWSFSEHTFARSMSSCWTAGQTSQQSSCVALSTSRLDSVSELQVRTCPIRLCSDLSRLIQFSFTDTDLLRNPITGKQITEELDENGVFRCSVYPDSAWQSLFVDRLSEQLYDVWKREMFSKMLVETWNGKAQQNSLEFKIVSRWRALALQLCWIPSFTTERIGWNAALNVVVTLWPGPAACWHGRQPPGRWGRGRGSASEIQHDVNTFFVSICFFFFEVWPAKLFLPPVFPPGKQQGKVFVDVTKVWLPMQWPVEVFTGRRADIPHKQHIRAGALVFASFLHQKTT